MPFTMNAEVLLNWIELVTLLPTMTLAVPVPLPLLVIVPTLFNAIVVALIRPVLLALNIRLPVPVAPPESVRVFVPLLVRVVPLLFTPNAPLIVSAEVLLLSVIPVTFMPIAALIVVVPVPPPVLVIVPVLFIIPVLKVIVPLVLLLITRLFDPVTPPVNVVDIPEPVVPTINCPVLLLANTIALANVRPDVLTSSLAVPLPLLTPRTTLPVPRAELLFDTINVPPTIVVVPL